VILAAESLGDNLRADVAVVGAGPGGIVTALELADGGLDVLLLESGRLRDDPAAQALGDAAELDADRHAPMAITTRRGVGGTSAIWGGRCVPFDPVDFDDRAHVPQASWPISHEDVEPYLERACAWCVCGRPVFDTREVPHLRDREIVPGFVNGDVRATALERWSLPTDFGREHRARLRDSHRVRLVTGLTCTEVVCDGGDRPAWLEARRLDGSPVRVTARAYVLACGGVETTRLLLASRRDHPEGLGNASGHLGRWYMAHMEGSVANVRFATDPARTICEYERDTDGVYVRRRLTFTRAFQHEHRLPNIVGWLANPSLADPSHGSGILSFVYLALRSPLGGLFAPDAQRASLTGEKVPGAPYGPVERGPVRAHLRNLVRDLPSTAAFAASFGFRRFVPHRKAPGFFVRSKANLYPLQYHAEHLPNAESRITLSDERDALGMPRVRIDIRFSDADVEGVLRAHALWDEHLRRHGLGRLEYLDDPAARVRDQAGGGFHQLGTTRMSSRPEDGVVDPDLRVHGLRDLYVVSSSVCPTSSQANSTFMIVALAVRLADHLRAVLSGGAPAVAEGAAA